MGKDAFRLCFHGLRSILWILSVWNRFQHRRSTNVGENRPYIHHLLSYLLTTSLLYCTLCNIYWCGLVFFRFLVCLPNRQHMRRWSMQDWAPPRPFWTDPAAVIFFSRPEESQLTLGTLVLVCGGYFDALDAWQQSQGLRPCVDMSPPPGTCYFAGDDFLKIFNGFQNFFCQSNFAKNSRSRPSR